MKKIMNRKSFALKILLLISFLTAYPLQGKAQASGSEDDDIKLKLYVETDIEYTDNVFRLTESQISKMETNAQEDTAGGRFKDMESLSDYIVSPEIGLGIDSDSPFGGNFSMTSWLRYNYYSENTDCSFPEGRIRLKNSIGKKGTLILEGDLLFDFFKKNYLSGINDENENGNITREERIYSPANYDEYEGKIAYKHEFINNKDGMVSGLALEPFAGYRVRQYNSAFSNRDQDVIFMGVALNLEFVSKIDMEMTYQYEDVSAPGDSELVLFDETARGLDVNDDGDITANAPLVTVIDRSSTRHTIEITPSIKLTKDTRIFVGYEKRIAECSSDNLLDIDHYDQKEYRQQINSGIRHDFSKKWSGEAEYRRTDEEEEDGDYSENSFLVKLRYDF